MLTFFLIATCRESNIKTDNWSFVFQFIVVALSLLLLLFVLWHFSRNIIRHGFSAKVRIKSRRKKHHPCSFKRSAQLDNALRISHTHSSTCFSYSRMISCCRAVCFRSRSLSLRVGWVWKFYFACTWLLARHFTNIRFCCCCCCSLQCYSASPRCHNFRAFALSNDFRSLICFLCAAFYAVCSNSQFTK